MRYVVRLCSPRAMVGGAQIEGFHAQKGLAQENGKTRGNKKRSTSQIESRRHAWRGAGGHKRLALKLAVAGQMEKKKMQCQ